MKVTQVQPHNIVHVELPTQYDLCMTFVRIQEYYESPKFKGKVFTLEEYMDWYASEHDGIFTYTADWSGFNVPGHIMDKFFSEFCDLRPREEKLEREIDPIWHRIWHETHEVGQEEKYYIIGTIEGAPLSTMEHEMRHAFFYLYEDYEKRVRKIVSKYPLKRLRKKLLKMGYHQSVIVDEIQAYVLTGVDEDMKVTQAIKNMRKELQEVEKEYTTKDLKRKLIW